MAVPVLRYSVFVAGLAALGLSACTSYIKRDEFESTVADLRAADQRLQQQIDALSQKHDALVTEMAGRVRVETGAHFEFNDATLAEQDKPLLDDFARVIRSSRSDALITVEGFADPAGSAGYNKRLGMRRAESVRNYLVSSGGLADAQVRAVSYGEDRDRQVRPGATHEAGRDNRRVSLVIDYASAGASAPAGLPGQQPSAQEQDAGTM